MSSTHLSGALKRNGGVTGLAPGGPCGRPIRGQDSAGDVWASLRVGSWMVPWEDQQNVQLKIVD